jgi:hypothetical protein|tara:strand:- start:378 stop:1244 length:867 start_codon:yes stop_codon:yes gene_type:complete
MYSKQLEKKIDSLLIGRGITGHVAADRFRHDFKVNLCYFDTLTDGDAEITLSLLEDESILTSTDILGTNFRKSLWDLVPEKLKKDIIFPLLFQVLLSNNGKGIGKGELILPLIFSDYQFSVDNDGRYSVTKKSELKDDGASLKVIKTGVTDKGLVDKLNQKYFEGNAPGYVDAKLFAKHVESVQKPEVYFDYFSELYPGCDVTQLVEDVKKDYKDPIKFNTAVGKFALKRYKEVDKWDNIMYIKDKTMEVVNISDPSNIDSLNLKFTPKFKRGGDTQAIADGYVNVKI